MAIFASVHWTAASILLLGLGFVNRAAGDNLRVLTVGDSITAGVGSSDGSGYRLDLENLLTNAGHTVEMIGSQTNGATEDEGFGFNRISQIQAHMVADNILDQKPNVILLHAGTNDNWFLIDGETYEAAPARYATLVDYILCHNTDAVLLVAELINNKQNQTQTDYFNAQVYDIVNPRLDKGYKINVVDQAGVQGSLLSDLLHPNDQGYQVMAQNWFNAIQKLPSGWITAPLTPSSSSGGAAHEVCARDDSSFTAAIGGNNLFDGAHIANDPGTSIGPGDTWSPGWGQQEIIAIGTGYGGTFDDYHSVRFMDLDGDGRSDYVFVESNNGSLRAWLNKGHDAWEAVDGGGEIVWGIGDDTNPIVFLADLNGDGRDDYIAIDTKGNSYAWLNAGPNGQVWLWNQVTFPLPTTYLDSSGDYSGFFIMGDLNGDGRADMSFVNFNNGGIDIYFQTGDIGTSSFGWQPCLNKGLFDFSTTTRLFFKDIDGDDYLAVDFHSGITGFLNKPGGSCDISWVKAGGTDGIALGAAPGTAYVELADYDGDKKVDYMAVNQTNGVVWWNQNTGSSHNPDDTGNGGYGSAVRLADLDGDGIDDYISVGPNGEARGFKNGGQSGNSWTWTELGTGGYIAIGVGASREMVQFADMNGDGLADYLVVDPQTGGVHCYLNKGPNSWQDSGLIAIGVGRDGGVGVRFADMNADGRADYIYLDQNGVMTVWINGGTGDDMSHWVAQNNGAPAAIGVGAQREDVRIADIDGDGLADYIWVHPDTGAADLWYNGSPEGSNWVSAGQIATGVGVPGKDVTFARMGPSGRADYVAIAEDTGAVRAWINSCSNVVGGHSSSSGTCDGPPVQPFAEIGRDKFISWGSIGDSYCSGVTYDGRNTDYDDNSDSCQRTREAYSAQMERGASGWVTKPFQNTNFYGCSGSRLEDMHMSGKKLINRININVDFLIMQAGGNNCDFFDILIKCLFTPYTLNNKGIPYDKDPQCVDACCQALQKADDYIHKQGDGGLASDLLNTMNDIAGTFQASYEPFWLLIPGYAQFFAVPDGDTDDCSDWSFAPWWVGSPFKVTKPLRVRINQLVSDLNSVYSNTIGGWQPPNGRNQHAIYVDIDSGYQGHRFCEAGASYDDQYYGNAVWFWNLMFTVSRDVGLSGNNLTNCHEIDSSSDVTGIGQNINNTLTTDDYSATSDYGGVIGRTFHPTSYGHWSIGNKMVVTLYNAGVPGVGVNALALPEPWDKSRN